MNAIPPLAPPAALEEATLEPAPVLQAPLRKPPFRFAGEVYGFLCGSLLVGALDAFAQWDRESAWFWIREPGSVELAMGRWRLIVSWAPAKGSAA